MRATRSFVARFGRRGIFLLFLTLLDALYALNLARPLPEARQTPATAYISHVLPLPVWAAMWAFVGIVCAIGAFLRRDQWAFACAMALKVLWSLTFLFGWIFYGLPRGWVSGIIWLAFAAFVYLISTWPEDGVDLRRRER